MNVGSMFRDDAIPFEEQQVFERLTILSEECAEVQKEISKIFRFGSSAFNPLIEDSVSNKENLECEIGDLIGMVESLVMHGFLNSTNINNASAKKQQKIKLWMRNF